jgi:hypothetical protein
MEKSNAVNLDRYVSKEVGEGEGSRGLTAGDEEEERRSL